MLGYLTPKRENLGGNMVHIRNFQNSSFLQTPKREMPTYVLASEGELSSPSLGLTTLYTESTPLYTPPMDLGDNTAYWHHFQGHSPDTPLRRQQAPPERTLLVERLPQPYMMTPERQAMDFLSPERVRHGSGQDSGKRGRPRADIVTNLMMEGAQSNNAIKCHICSRYVLTSLH